MRQDQSIPKGPPFAKVLISVLSAVFLEARENHSQDTSGSLEHTLFLAPEALVPQWHEEAVNGGHFEF